jgi:hypothetical protein
VPSLERQDSSNQAWALANDSSRKPSPKSSEPASLIDLDPAESATWDDVGHDARSPLVEKNQYFEDNAWQEVDSERERQVGASLADLQEDQRSEGGWETIQPQEVGLVQLNAPAGVPSLPPRPSEEPPTLPPRSQDEPGPLLPPRPNSGAGESSTPQTSSSNRREQKKETYEIKKIRWYDAQANKNPRTSPILIQNANGPCPLLALVNALVLSTPAELKTTLVETLRSREQVSLEFLLNAVFDELMSGRRGTHELPDVSELYSFLVTLHTGMNVNPRFFPPAPTNLMDDIRRSMSHVHPSERDETIPGTFEETKEMRLYSTFSIPLIHGWLPEVGSPEYAALSRSAITYEDAQNLMFKEEELEDKLAREGLSFEEQTTLEDISTIKAFFTSSATQLTTHGLETIIKSLAPGSVAILFRNDHFSTLYKHPESHQILQLVTDMGYAGHEEVVWESLVDLNGENAELFSGDFRLVGGSQPTSQETNDNVGWSTVPTRNGRQSTNPPINDSVSQPANIYENISPSTTEQEDHDLALALQLQEEEEERHRNETAQRRREAELSQRYIEQQGNSISIPVTNIRGGAVRGRGAGVGVRGGAVTAPMIPPRRSNTGVSAVISRPAEPDADADVPPPSYAQAATEPSYNPPPNHPAHPSANPNAPAAQILPSPQARRSSTTASMNSRTQTRPGRASVGGRGSAYEVQSGRRQSYGMAQQPDERSKDCIVM